MVRHLFAAKRSNEWVVSAVNSTAFRNEITLLQQLDAVFLEEQLDRARTCFVRTDMDIADALRHAASIVFASISERWGQGLSFVEHNGPTVLRESRGATRHSSERRRETRADQIFLPILSPHERAILEFSAYRFCRRTPGRGRRCSVRFLTSLLSRPCRFSRACRRLLVRGSSALHECRYQTTNRTARKSSSRKRPRSPNGSLSYHPACFARHSQ